MARMYPKNLSECMPTDSERIVFFELKNQLPDSFDVFYSVKWTTYDNGKLVKSEADFIVASPDYGFLCIEVKGGNDIRVDENNIWYVSDAVHGERKLNCSPHDQAEKSMYYFSNAFSNKYNMKYSGIYGAGVILPFYPIREDLNLDNRHRACTIDSNDLNNLYEKIKRMFRVWGGSGYGRNLYPRSQHRAFLELVRERLAISAAAGALIKYKEQQFDIINRVQENYIYFLSNVRQFYVRGGAGTGKTFIAMKMAIYEAQDIEKTVLYVCSTKELSDVIRKMVEPRVYVSDINSLFLPENENGVLKYDAIFVDEAQDFSETQARKIKKLLRQEDVSRLGVFYDDVQIVRDESFGEGFGIDSLPFLLHENIRNTANIYQWTAEKTNLGRDMIANPVEGPSPISEVITERGQLTLLLEGLLKKYFDDEYLPNDALVIISDDKDNLLDTYKNGLAKWTLVNRPTTRNDEVSVYSIEEFKGLEANMVVYIHGEETNNNLNYIAYTRAKYYLIEYVRRF